MGSPSTKLIVNEADAADKIHCIYRKMKKRHSSVIVDSVTKLL